MSQNFHPAQCPNPNPCVPKPKPIPMHSPQSDGSRHPGKHSPQSDGSRHCLGGMVIKNCVVALDTSLPCFLPLFHGISHVFPCFLRAVLSRPMSAAKKEKKKLLQTACHICNKKGCQAA